MPLYINSKAGKHGKLGIWHITETLGELLAMKPFSPNDLANLASFSRENRKKEWLVSRILVDQLTNKDNIEIFYDEHNKPFLKGSKKNISISHSHGLLAVLLDDDETGIDIELLKPGILRIKEKFMSEKELQSLKREHLEEQLTLYWCVKESLYKYYGKKQLTFKKNLPVEPFTYTLKGKVRASIVHPTMKKKFNLHYETISAGANTFLMAYILNQD
ncbi:MAG TPA: 4'-phosphopantetheinyl transferase superfamily protein [Bacteroidia bacterium]